MTSNTSKKKLLSKKAILAAPKKAYMNADQLAYFNHLLLELYDSTLSHIQAVKEQMRQPHDLSDASDLASWQEQSDFSLRIVDREQKLLPKIKEALKRIRLKTYGYCEESGEKIGIERLIARPTAIYNLDVKLIKEINEGNFKKER
jgi:DnaK suppressor protein